MYLIRITSLVFALGLLVAKLFASPAQSPQDKWNNDNTRTYQIAPFSKIYLEGTFKVVLEQGNHERLEIKTDEDNYENISVDSDRTSGTLKIVRKHFNFEEITLYLTFVNLEQLVIKGGLSLDTRGYVDLKDFDLHVEGGACITMNLKVDNIKVTGAGGVKFEFNGIAKELDAKISGAGYLNAIELKARKVDFSIEGLGAGSVYATDILYAKVSGLGKIRYRGEPQVFRKVEGFGRISQD